MTTCSEGCRSVVPFAPIIRTPIRYSSSPFLLMGAAIAIAVAASANVIYVDDNAASDPGPATPHISDPLEDGSAAHPFDAIAEAISAAHAGDEIVLLAGTYQGVGNVRLSTAGKAITIRSDSGPRECVIDCDPLPDDPNAVADPESTNWGFKFSHAEGPGTVLEGVTIRDATFDGIGPAIECLQASPTIRNCWFINNRTPFFGVPQGADRPGAMYLYRSAALVENCRFERSATSNYYEGEGGALTMERSTATIRNCVFRFSAAYSGPTIAVKLGSPTISGCVFDRNLCNLISGADIGVIVSNANQLTLDHCTFVGNLVSPVSSTNSLIHTYGNGAVTVTDSIFWDNAAGAANQPSVSLSYCIVEGGAPGVGNFDANPLLTRDGAHISAHSPAIGAGNPGAPSGVDADGDLRPAGAAAIGADEFVDTDSDALPDWFELNYFGDAIAANPSSDTDTDGLTNLEEYVAARIPTRAAVRTYLAVDGDDGWDGTAPGWDGAHGPKATIQAALEVADDEEPGEIILTDGVYSGPNFTNIAPGPKPVTIRGMNGAENAIIEGQSGAPVFWQYFDGAQVTLLNLTIRGGSYVVYCYGSRINLTRCVLPGDGPNGAANDGLNLQIAVANVDDCDFSSRNGHAIEANRSWLSLSQSRLRDNHVADDGAGLSADGSLVRLSQCEIADNVAGGLGGGVFSDEGILQAANCVIAGNQAQTGGGMALMGEAIGVNLLIAANQSTGNGGGVVVTSSAPATMINCTFADNNANAGGAIHTTGALNLYNSLLHRNSTIGNGREIHAVTSGAHVIVRSSLINPAPNSVMAAGGAQLDIDGTVFFANAQYLNPDGPDGDPQSWQDNDYRVDFGSTAVNAGSLDLLTLDLWDLDQDEKRAETTPRDLDGNRRIAECTVDIGAYEAPYESPYFADINNDGIPDECQCVADIVPDGMIDLLDLSTLLASFGAPNGATFADGDLDGDRDVDIVDLSALLANFGRICGG